MEYKQLSLEEAAEYVILEKLESQDAKGGLIALDKDGNVVMEFNTAGMFRAYQTQDTSVVEMFN